MNARMLFLALSFALTAMPVRANQAEFEDQRASAQEAYLAGEYRQAESLLNELLAKNPHDADLVRRIAAVQAAMGELDQAQATIDRAIALAPADGDIKLARANILLWRKRYTEAAQQAEELSYTDPDYPGLGQFRASLLSVRQARRLRLRSVAVGATVSDTAFTSGSEQTWLTQRAKASIGWEESAIAAVEVEREERLLTDTRISPFLDIPISSHRVFFSGTVTPNADFRESWSLGMGAAIALRGPDNMRIEGRFSHYRRSEIGTISIGFQHSFAPDFSVTARSIHFFGGGGNYRLGGVLRADYSPSDRPSLFTLVASYPDVEADGTRQLRTVAGGARFKLSNRYTLSFAGGYEARKNSYSRTTISADLNWNFGGRR